MAEESVQADDRSRTTDSAKLRLSRYRYLLAAFVVVVLAVVFVLIWPSASKGEICVPNPLGDDPICVKAEKEPIAATEADQSQDTYVFSDLGFEIDRPKGLEWSSPERLATFEDVLEIQGLSVDEFEDAIDAQLEAVAEAQAEAILSVTAFASSLSEQEILEALDVAAVEVGLAALGAFDDPAVSIAEALAKASGLDVDTVLSRLNIDLDRLRAAIVESEVSTEAALGDAPVDLTAFASESIPSVLLSHGDLATVEFTATSAITDFLDGEILIGEGQSLEFGNRALFTVFPKEALTVDPPSPAEFAVFLTSSLYPGNIESFSADEERVLFVMSFIASDVVVDGTTQDFRMTRAVLIEESRDDFYIGEITYSDITGASVEVWTDLLELLQSFGRVA